MNRFMNVVSPVRVVLLIALLAGVLVGLLAAAPPQDHDAQVLAALRAEVARLRADVQALQGQTAALASTVHSGDDRKSSPQHLTARSLTILDKRGRRVALISGADGCGVINLWDANMDTTDPQIVLGCIQHSRGGGTQLWMQSAAGQRAINLVAQDKGRVHTW